MQQYYPSLHEFMMLCTQMWNQLSSNFPIQTCKPYTVDPKDCKGQISPLTLTQISNKLKLTPSNHHLPTPPLSESPFTTHIQKGANNILLGQKDRTANRKNKSALVGFQPVTLESCVQPPNPFNYRNTLDLLNSYYSTKEVAV